MGIRTTTVETTETPVPKLVDLAILRDVHDRASVRLEGVRDEERAASGIAKTDLTDVARAALRRWTSQRDAPRGRRPALVWIEPAETVPKTVNLGPIPDGQEVFVARCSACEYESYGLTRASCRGDSKGHAATHTRTFRFTMDRATYDQIKRAIHSSGMSVAGVVQDGLDAFANTGSY